MTDRQHQRDGGCDAGNHREESNLTYSCRTASIGSIEAARRAGAKHAMAATADSRTVTPPRISGSRELSVTHREAALSKIRDRTTPASSPAPTFQDVAESTIRTTSRALAPSARRMPNSLVLVAT